MELFTFQNIVAFLVVLLAVIYVVTKVFIAIKNKKNKNISCGGCNGCPSKSGCTPSDKDNCSLY